METYKKPVIASKHECQAGALTAAAPLAALVLTKLVGDDDFHPENSRALTTRKEFTAK